MAEITWEMRRRYGHMVGWIPNDLLARIDQDEVLDRLDEAEALYKKFEAAPQEFAYGYVEQAQQICKAAPRDEVERAATEWLSKADAAHTAQHAAGCREQARLIRLANPSATRRERRPTPAQVRHAEALAALKADITSMVKTELCSGTARLDQLAAGVAEVTARVDVMRKTAGPTLTGTQRPDLTK